MDPVLIEALHIFVIVVIGAFIILSVLAAAGKYDHWTTRFIRRHIFRRKPGVNRPGNADDYQNPNDQPDKPTGW